MYTYVYSSLPNAGILYLVLLLSSSSELNSSLDPQLRMYATRRMGHSYVATRSVFMGGGGVTEPTTAGTAAMRLAVQVSIHKPLIQHAMHVVSLVLQW